MQKACRTRQGLSGIQTSDGETELSVTAPQKASLAKLAEFPPVGRQGRFEKETMATHRSKCQWHMTCLPQGPKTLLFGSASRSAELAWFCCILPMQRLEKLFLTCRIGILSRTGLATGKKQWVNSRFVVNVRHLRTIRTH